MAKNDAVRVPNADWISAAREGIIFCDATSAAFAQPLDWSKLDVVTFSWQKALGGEAAHGMLILSARAVARLESYTPAWPLPKIFRMTKGGKVNRGIFEGETINTPSMLAVEDYLDTLAWAKSAGGLKGLMARADANAKVLHDWVAKTPWVANLADVAATRSNTSVCLKIVDPAITSLSVDAQWAFVKDLVALIEREGAAFDIATHRDAPPGQAHHGQRRAGGARGSVSTGPSAPRPAALDLRRAGGRWPGRRVCPQAMQGDSRGPPRGWTSDAETCESRVRRRFLVDSPPDRYADPIVGGQVTGFRGITWRGTKGAKR